MRSSNLPQLPAPASYPLGRLRRPRSLWGQFWTAVLRPGLFFATMPTMEETRTWLWAAILVLGLVGYSAVRQAALQGGVALPDPSMGGEAVAGDPAATWTIALIAASGVLAGWLGQTVLLCEVSLLHGRAPRLGQNFQVAVWSSVPLALMAGLQLVYYASGGNVGAPGLSGLLGEMPQLAALPVFWRTVVATLAAQLTVFWLWGLLLLFAGARVALRGAWWSAMFVLLSWVAVVLLAPALLLHYTDVRLPWVDTPAIEDAPPAIDSDDWMSAITGGAPLDDDNAFPRPQMPRAVPPGVAAPADPQSMDDGPADDLTTPTSDAP